MIYRNISIKEAQSISTLGDHTYELTARLIRPAKFDEMDITSSPFGTRADNTSVVKEIEVSSCFRDEAVEEIKRRIDEFLSENPAFT